MSKIVKKLGGDAVVMLLLIPLAAAGKKGSKDQTDKKEITGDIPCLLWRDPVDIRTRDLYYGPGGKEDEPRSTFTFLKEDRSGTNPKFNIQDQEGVKWKVKLGPEAQPETVASRLVWAAGYFADEDYFLPVLHAEHMALLHRG